MHGVLYLRETLRAVGMREGDIGWVHAMCLAVDHLRDPADIIWGRSGLVPNESAVTTDREQGRCDEPLFPLPIEAEDAFRVV